MHLRRALLLFAIVLGVAAIAASLAPPPRTERDRTEPERPPAAVEQPAEADVPDAQLVEVSFDAAAPKPTTQSVEAGAHVVVSLRATEPGQARLDGFGLVADVDPRTPATFDIFATRPGRYAVGYAPVSGEERRVGTLVVSSGA